MGNKPRLFIGSSLEGLQIADAVHSNLMSDSEVTVWNQGVFELSKSSVESVLVKLEMSDFGMFVFSPDDIAIIRNEEFRAIRDNVILELGAFLGRLGRERCFILLPDNDDEVRIPTDLIGMEPGHYETNRSDNNYRAATAPFCSVIKTQMKKLGFFEKQTTGESTEIKTKREELDDALSLKFTDEKNSENVRENDWFSDYSNKKFQSSLDQIENVIKVTSDIKIKDSLLNWKGVILFEMDNSEGIKHMEELIKTNSDKEQTYSFYSWMLLDSGKYNETIMLSEKGIKELNDPSILFPRIIDALKALGKSDEIKKLIDEFLLTYPDNISVISSSAKYYSNIKDFDSARKILDNAVSKLPNELILLEQYALLLTDNGFDKEALLFYNKIIDIDNNNINAHGYRANIYLILEMNGLAMIEYKLANKLSENTKSWVVGNIGNLYKNVGLYCDAIKYLKKSLELDPDSDYAHDRLALSIRSNNDELNKLKEIEEEAKINLSKYRYGNNNINQ